MVSFKEIKSQRTPLEDPPTLIWALHLQTDGQTKVINKNIVHILHMYNCKNMSTWDESLPYIQHNYNIVIHSSTEHNPFQVGLRFQPMGPMDVALPLAST